MSEGSIVTLTADLNMTISLLQRQLSVCLQVGRRHV